jgi:hypothetical protein
MQHEPRRRRSWLIFDVGQMSHIHTYAEKMKGLVAAHGSERAMELVVGGDYQAQGNLEKSLLLALGLRPTDCVVDIGCGSGRLAFALREGLSGKYVGTDILADPSPSRKGRGSGPIGNSSRQTNR